MDSPVEILLSTFNGEKYLNTQLESLFRQEYTHWKLLIRDDGSTDATLSILNTYIQKYPDKIKLVNDEEGNIGYANSFIKLLRQSSADYVMYCDQDDSWHPSKISTLLSVILQEETKSPDTAHIVFSDLQLVDSEMNTIAPSFARMMKYSPKRNIRVFFLKSYVPGCNLIFNRTLIQQALKTENIVNLHDYWLLMVCSAIGKIAFVKQPLMKYRIHDKNAIGFSNKKNSFLSDLLLFVKDVLKYGVANKKYRTVLYWANIQQMQNICERLKANVSKDAMLFAGIDKSNYFLRKIKSITQPYLLERSLLKQLTYIICF